MGFLTGSPSLSPPVPAPEVTQKVDTKALETEAARQDRLRRIMELQAQKRASIYGSMDESDKLGGNSLLG